MKSRHQSGGGKHAPYPHTDKSAGETEAHQIKWNNHGHIPKSAAKSAEVLRIRIGAPDRKKHGGINKGAAG